jgi:hypothetical protein
LPEARVAGEADIVRTFVLSIEQCEVDHKGV